MTIDSTGFRSLRLSDFLALFRDGAISAFGSSVNLSASSKFGLLFGIAAGELSRVSEQVQAIYDAYSVNNAQGQYLINLAVVAGLTPFVKSKSTVFIQTSGTVGTPIPIGSIVRNDANEEFISTAAGVVGDDIPFTASEYGTMNVSAGAFDTSAGARIMTPITGWSSCNNDAGFAGRLDETESELRTRIGARGVVSGWTTIDAIFGYLNSNIGGASYVTVVENDTDLFDPATGLPSHSIGVCVHPPTVVPQNVVDSILACKAAGVRAIGTETGTAVDTQGFEHTIGFSYSTSVELYIEFTTGPTGVGYPGDALVAEAAQEYVNGLALGEDFVPASLLCYLKETISGMPTPELVEAGRFGSMPPFGTDPVEMGRCEIAVVVDINHIDINP